MDALKGFLDSLHGPGLEHMIQWGGFVVLFAIIFAETGLLFGFFLPGDSLLFTAGALVGTGLLKAPAPLPDDPVTGIVTLCLALMVAAIGGDNVGYWFGRKTGPKLFEREESRIFKRSHLLKTQAFYEKHGGKTLIMARWMPFARTFAPIIAGVSQMPYAKYIPFSIIGGVTWITSMCTLGFLFGNNEFARKHNEQIVIGIILLSIAPAVIHGLKSWLATRKGGDASSHAANDGS
jgi:membrane-associated protein